MSAERGKKIPSRDVSFHLSEHNHKTLVPVPYGHTTFDGVNEYINVPNHASLSFERTNTFSISFWMYQTDAINEHIVGKWGSPKGYFIRTDSSRRLYLGMQGNSSNYLTKTYPAAKTPLNNWHHIVMTYDGSETLAGLKTYINNVEETASIETNTLAGNSIDNTQPFRLGFTSGIGYFTGKLDKVIVYNDVVTSGEVTTLYNYGRTPDLVGIGNEVAQWELDTLNPIDVISSNNGTSNNMDSTNIVVDGYENNLTNLSNKFVTPTLTNGALVQSGSFSFDGVDDYIDCGDILNFERTDSFSFSIWVYKNALGTTNVILGKANIGVQGYRIFVDSSNKVVFQLYNTDTTNDLRVTTDAIITATTWIHITVTYDGSSSASGVKIYKNGASESLTTVYDTLSATTVNTLLFSIGNEDVRTGVYWNGNIDEISII